MRRTQREGSDLANFIEVTTGDAPPSFEVTRSTQTDKDGNPKYGYTAKLYYATRADLLAHAVDDAAVLDLAFCARYEQAPGASPAEVVDAEVVEPRETTEQERAAQAFAAHMEAIRCKTCGGTGMILDRMTGEPRPCPQPHVR